YIMTSLYNAIITSNATAALLFPIALSTATALQADAHAFAIAVMIAAAASFATPISYQTNLMVYSPGGYKFKDFLKIGIPLQILIGIVA
ncbi:SLC13 family permease, partial [Candidatus Saccharibacteria bacterium]|nr:SLC13 family permease [Calditrichia bacterium]NIV97859.1 SLC13 family permease [Candidatus Saccharibacteria bacterium]NIW78145.1 SLC13 family permease [Calditrichia bacterium]